MSPSPHSSHIADTRSRRDYRVAGCRGEASGHGISTNTAIARIMHRGGRATGVVDGAGHVHEADAVCVVAGPWTDALLAPMGVKLASRASARIASFKRAPELKHCIYIDTIAGSYFRPHGGDRRWPGWADGRPRRRRIPTIFARATMTTSSRRCVSGSRRGFPRWPMRPTLAATPESTMSARTRAL